jgi:hypothetical protein
MGNYLDYATVPCIIIGLSVVFVIGFSFAPESPSYLAINNRMDEAENGLRYFRGINKTTKWCGTEKYFIEVEELRKIADTHTDKLGHHNKLEMADFSKQIKKLKSMRILREFSFLPKLIKRPAKDSSSTPSSCCSRTFAAPS